jgi:nucleoside-diphosphate-sugar epimerase
MKHYNISNRIIKSDIQTILSEGIDWEYLKGKTVLVTGANGFIPSYIIYTLVELNLEKFQHNPISIIALVRNREKAENKFSFLLPKKYFQLLVMDVSEPFAISQKIDIIIHAASQASSKYYGIDPVGTLKANTIGTANMLTLACNNCTEKFLFISSDEIYGATNNKRGKITESYTGNVDITNVRSCYAESKRMGETMCVCWSHQFKLHVNMVRLSGTYGPGLELDDGRAPADFVRHILQNEDIVLNSNGRVKRPFLYITDTIVALFRVLFYGKDSQPYNVAADSNITIIGLAKMLTKMYPDKNIYVKIKKNVFPAGYMRSPRNKVNLSNTKLKELGWSQKISIQDGFRRMVESYKDE